MQTTGGTVPQHSPFECTEDGRGLGRATGTVFAQASWRKPNGQSDEAGKPKDHGERFDGDDGVDMGHPGEEDGHERQIWQGNDQCPDRVEQVEVDAVR